MRTPTLSQPSPFAKPIPGESLTDEPGAMAWERPPRFVHLDEATEFVWNKLMQPQNMGGALSLMEQGVSAQEVTDLLIFQGFCEGQWTVTLGLLMVLPVYQMICGIGERAKIKFKRRVERMDPLRQMMSKLAAAEKYGTPDLLDIGKDESEEPPAAGATPPMPGQPPAGPAQPPAPSQPPMTGFMGGMPNG